MLNGDGSFTYTPDADVNGSDSFAYQISDGNGGSAQAVVTITINPVNDAPAAVNDTLIGVLNTSGLIDSDDLLTNDIDVDGDNLSLVSLTQPISGFVTLNSDGSILYVPNAGFVGVDTFSYTITDPAGEQATGLVIVNVTAGLLPRLPAPVSR